MKTKLLFKQISLLFLVTIFLFKPTSANSQASPKYNVLFIAVDDMNDRVGFLGNSEVVSPNLQRLVSRGMVFKSAYCQYALCNPSRTSFLSGWRPDKTRIFDNGTNPRSTMGADVKFLPEFFKQYGYRIERYGKIMHGLFENDIPWDYQEPAPSSRDPDSSNNTATNDCTRKYGSSAGPDWWINDVSDSKINVRVNDLVSHLQQQTQPFFYALGLSVHHSFTPSLKYWNMNGDPSVQEPLPINARGDITDLKGNGSEPIIIPSTPAGDRNDVPCVAFTGQEQLTGLDWKRVIHAYDGEVAQMDEQLGIVFDEMDRQNLWNSTIVVFVSDHGQHLGEHEGLWGKLTLFEESLRVPLIVCVPGKVASECGKLVELVDLFPTLAELSGLPSPTRMQGWSFAPLLDNPGLPWKKAAFSQVKRANSTTIGRSVCTGQYVYNSWGSAGEELYDQNSDPHEYINLATDPQYASVLNEMRTVLADGWTKAVPPPQCADPKTFYIDNDGDGFGDPSVSVQACSAPAGFVEDNTDCDDNNVAVDPTATEVCNGIDDNCDGQVDEGLTCNADNDHDGFTVVQGDCNDNNANVHPGALEICGNAVDDDCDGQIDEGCSSTCSNATGLTTTNITSKSATLNWSASVNPARWQVQYRKAISGATWTNIKPAGSARSVNISSLTANQRYNWHIRAKCGTTWTAYSATLSFTTLSALQSTIQLSASAKNMANENITMLQLYPNPSKGQFVIDLHMGEKISVNAKIELIDMMGQTVYRETGSLSNGKLQRTISMPSSLSRGFYMVKVIVNDNVYVTKLILAK